MENLSNVLNFYENLGEIDRLHRGLGVVEGARTKELLSRYIEPGMTVYDVGGGAGYYSDWLAGLGCQVTMFDLAPSAVAYAKTHQTAFYETVTADARRLPAPVTACDALLLMGPLYHLMETESRLQALVEAKRVLRPGGVLAAAGISRFSNATWTLRTYGTENQYMDEEIYMDMVRNELSAGEHHRPKEYPTFLTEAYFHSPDALRQEISQAGFTVDALLAVEGISWVTPELNTVWENVDAREKLLDMVRLTESEPSLLGMSPHFFAVARK